MRSLINASLHQFWLVRRNSGVNFNVKLVHSEEFRFTETSDIFDDNKVFARDSNVRRLRDNKNADLVILLTNANYGNALGVVSDIGVSIKSGHAIVEVSAATSNFTFTHEIGHLLGARHDNDPTPGDAHGDWWLKWGLLRHQRYRSIMAVVAEEPSTFKKRQRVGHFSNPHVKHEGKATGISGSRNNARVINANAGIVSRYRTAAPVFKASVYGPSSAHSGQSIRFTSQVNNGTPPFTYSWTSKTTYNQSSSHGSNSTKTTNMPYGGSLTITLTVKDSKGKSVVRNLFVENNAINDPDSDERIALDKLDVTNVNDDTPNFDAFVQLFPNPADDYVVIPGFQGSSKLSVQIISSNGNIIDEIVFQENDERVIPLFNVKKGVYHVRVVDEDKINNFRLVKK